MNRSKLEVGDLILAIDGQPVSSDESVFGHLQGLAGRRIRLDVSRNGDQRTVLIQPVERRAFRNLLREQWIERNRALVDSLSGERIGYLYVRAMGSNDWLRFQRDFLSFNFERDALIIDVRGNSGGRIHNQLIDMLTARAHSYRIERNVSKIYDPHIRWEKPLAVLINEQSYSDREIFPGAVRTLGIGTLIGVPTNGSVIGTADVELLDGTVFRVPRTVWWTIEGCNQENRGVEPDIYIERMPEEHIQGIDSQLQRATEELLNILRSTG
jgi:tricorn protease